MTDHGARENAQFFFKGVTLHAFKKNDTPVWSLVPACSNYEHGNFFFGPLKFPITCRRVLVVRSCECCVYVGDYQLQVTGRSEILAFFRSQGAIFEDRELLASLQQRDACLTGSLSGNLVAVAQRKSIDRLANELEVFRGLQDRPSAHIVDFVGAFIDRDGNFLLATQYCAQGDLYAALTRRRFSLREAISVFKQILHGISDLHALGFVWRDCKPENILVCGSEKVCIADFSLACRADEPDLQQTRCGTLGYAAPEILMIPDARISDKCDLWSAGSVLFDLTVGNSLCAIFRLPEPELKNVNREVRCLWKGQGSLTVVYRDRKLKVDFQSDLLAELLAGLLDRDPSRRLDCAQALEICQLILAFCSCFAGYFGEYRTYFQGYFGKQKRR